MLHNLLSSYFMGTLSCFMNLLWLEGWGGAERMLPIFEGGLVTTTTGAVFCGGPEVCSLPMLSPDSFQYTPTPQKPPPGEAYTHSFGLTSKAAS